MRLSKVIFARISDVQNVSDTQRLNDMSVTSVMPIAQVESAREYLIRIALRCGTKNTSKRPH